MNVFTLIRSVVLKVFVKLRHSLNGEEVIEGDLAMHNSRMPAR